MLEFTELEHDALTEIFNISVANAATALGQMVGERISLSVPSIDISSRSQAGDNLVSMLGERISSVREEFFGSFSGDVLLLFPEQRSLDLVRGMIPDFDANEGMTDLAEDAFLEIGNVVINHCLNSMSSILNSKFKSEPPHYTQGAPMNVLSLSDNLNEGDDIVLLLRVNFSLEREDINGYLMLLFNLESLTAFRGMIRKWIDEVVS